MSFLNGLKGAAENYKKDFLRSYEKELRKVPDSMVLKKLSETSDEAYEITRKEARRRGLV